MALQALANYHGLLAYQAAGAALAGFAHLNSPDRRYQTLIYRGLLAVSTIVWFWYYRWVVETRAGWGVLAPGWSEEAPELTGFVWLSPLATYMLLGVALGLLDRPEPWSRLAAAALPLAICLITWLLALPVLLQGPPGQRYAADNMPQIWLFLESLTATVVLLAWDWKMRRPTAAGR